MAELAGGYEGSYEVIADKGASTAKSKAPVWAVLAVTKG